MSVSAVISFLQHKLWNSKCKVNLNKLVKIQAELVQLKEGNKKQTNPNQTQTKLTNNIPYKQMEKENLALVMHKVAHIHMHIKQITITEIDICSSFSSGLSGNN